MKRLQVDIPELLFDQIKEFSAKEGIKLYKFVENALLNHLIECEKERSNV